MVAAELEAIGLEVELEPVQYQSFALEEARLELAGTVVEPVAVGVNPFQGRYDFEGEAVVVTDPEQASQGITGRIVVTNHPLMQLMIADSDPAVVVCVSPEALTAFMDAEQHEAKLELRGRELELRSLNLVAHMPSRRPGGPEILVTSHLDAYQDSPGANDNGTGLGLMIELARVFARKTGQFDVPITFAAFGAEENGSIGSRAYIEKHLGELEETLAVINLDTLGGARGPVIAIKPTAEPGPAGAPRVRVPEELRNRAWEGPAGAWRILHPRILSIALASCYPGWLQSVVEESVADLGMELVHLDLISDHRSFALAGVPAISIQSKEHHIHSKQDTGDRLVPETIAAAGQLAAEILCRLQDHEQ
jgi:Iap family predicted aminopeptidase